MALCRRSRYLLGMATPVLPLAAQPVLPLEQVLAVILSETRWAILRELAAGKQMAVVELAELLGQTPAGISKHMGVLRENNFVNLGRNRLYSLRPDVIVDRDSRVIDLGWCVLRLNAGQGTAGGEQEQ